MSPRRLVLFDIDGTILRGGPVWKESFFAAVTECFPTIHLEDINFGGKTDLQICRELLAQAGLDSTEIENSMQKIGDRYIALAKAKVPPRRAEVELLPGVREIIEKLSVHSEVLLGLLTGNLSEGARLKLECVDLGHHFKFGVYGDDHWDRYELPTLALKRVQEKFGLTFYGKQIVVIGDTVHDINCGKSIGVRSIAVGTGRGIPHEELLKQNPDYFFRDLSNTEDVIQAILED